MEKFNRELGATDRLDLHRRGRPNQRRELPRRCQGFAPQASRWCAPKHYPNVTRRIMYQLQLSLNPENPLFI